MTEIAFHFNAPDKLAYACRFVRKVTRLGGRVTVVASPAALEHLDRALWAMAPTDFVAHCRAHADADLLMASPVVLAVSGEHGPHTEVLLNLEASVAPGFEQYTRVVEVVSATDETDRAQARQRWRQYAQQGYAIVRHDLVLRS